jgi:5-hydroxyisourate hydrolase-like protein (transthyretin family)
MRVFVPWLLVLSSFESAAGGTAHDALVDSSVVLESLVTAERSPAAADDELDWIDARLSALHSEVQGDPDLGAKLAAVEGLAWLVRHGRLAEPSLSRTGATTVTRTDGVAGATCETAIAVPAGSAARYAARAGDVLWFKVSSPGSRPLGFSTRGSTVDPLLELFDDCRTTSKPPLMRVDDTIGLQAELSLTPESRTYWLVRATVLAGIGEIATSAGVGVSWEGRVTNEATGAPLAGIFVSVHRIVNGSTQYLGGANTRDDGRYSLIAGQEFGTYAIRTGDFTGNSPLIHEAHSNFRCSVQAPWDFLSCGTTPGGSYTPINVTSSLSTVVDFALQQGGVLVGTITSSTGGPVVGGLVTLDDPVGPYVKETTTDTAGRYRIVGVPPVSLRLEASATDHARTRHQGIDCSSFPSGTCPVDIGTPVVVPLGTQARVDMSLRRLPFIEVDVTIDGQAITSPANVTVTALNANGFAVATGSATAANPRARIGPLVPGTYRVRAVSSHAFPQLYPAIPCATDCWDEVNQGTPIAVSLAGGIVSLSMDLQGFPQISGRLTDEVSGLPIEQAVVYLTQTPGFGWYSFVVGAGGNFRFAAVPAGQYQLRFSSDRHVDEAHDNIVCIQASANALCPGATPITIDRSTADLTIDAALRPSSSIGGRVLVDGTTGAPQGVTFDLLTPAGVTVASGNIFTNEDGRYRLEDVPSGSWLLGARLGFDSVPQLYRGIDCNTSNGFNFAGCPFAQATPLQVGDQSTLSGIDFTLRRGSTRGVRVVDDATGLPIPGVSIDVWDTAGRHVGTSTSDGDGRAYASVMGGTIGPFAVSTDNALGYRDEVFDNIGCAIGSVFFGGCALTGYTPIVLPATSTTPPITIGLSRRDELFIDGFEAR